MESKNRYYEANSMIDEFLIIDMKQWVCSVLNAKKTILLVFEGIKNPEKEATIKKSFFTEVLYREINLQGGLEEVRKETFPYKASLDEICKHFDVLVSETTINSWQVQDSYILKVLQNSDLLYGTEEERTLIGWATKILTYLGITYDHDDSLALAVNYTNANVDLMKAIAIGDIRRVKIALQKKADIDYHSVRYYKRTPLMLAAEKGYADIVKLLLTYKPKLDKITVTGFTALELAVENKHVESTKILVENGACCRQTTTNQLRRLLKSRNVQLVKKHKSTTKKTGFFTGVKNFFWGGDDSYSNKDTDSFHT